MHEEDDADDLDKDRQDVKHLSGMGHVEEDAKDINREQRKDDGLYGFDNDFLEIVADIFQETGIQMSQPESDSEGHDKCCHDIERLRNRYGKERFNTFGFTDFR